MSQTGVTSALTRANDWLRARFPVDQQVLVSMGSEPVPGHLKRWWWCLGGTPAYLFIVQAITGVLLTFYYVPTPDQAYDSVAMITDQMRFGWYIRSLHRWSASLMIIALLLHMMRVFFTGAYRKPREGNWMLGFVLLLLTLGFGFTGYSLVYEQLSYWGATVAGNILNAVPLIGPQLADFLRGGPTVGPNVRLSHRRPPDTHGHGAAGPPSAHADARRLGTGIAGQPGCEAVPLYSGPSADGNRDRYVPDVPVDVSGYRVPRRHGSES